jgi:hypothetical protein
MRYYIRVGKTKAEDWINGVGTAQVLAQNIFRLKKLPRKEICEESTYEVEGELEETRAAAAHLLTDLEPKIAPCYVVRIRKVDLLEAGVQEQDTVIGTTGIVYIDFRHRDLVGTKPQFEKLVEVILGYLRNGQDRIRRFGAPQLRTALEEFADLPPTERPTRTVEVIRCALTNARVAGLNADVELAIKELAQVTIPQDTISLRAFCLQKAKKGTGSQNGDWDKAQNELRDEYTKHYLHEQLGL